MSGAVLALVASSVDSDLSASVNQVTLGGFAYIPGTAQTSSSVTCTPANGVAPYTYLWSTADVTDIYPTDPTSPTTYFAVFDDVSSTHEANFICTVTDASATNVDSPNVSVTLRLRDSSDPFDL